MKRILSLLMLLATCSIAFSQNDQPIPMDKNTRVGKLSNGLTYYIRHNNLPENRADFYIAQRVGSVLEEDSQRGLAHFLEHMAFNGLKNLPGKTMMNYLEKIGVKFGENLNASTGFDQTNYLITNVPTTRQGIIDTCLLILHDWSSFISLDEAEIDNERGVIREEWRTRNSAGIRAYEAILPIIFQDSQYGHRMPIGLIEVINTFPYQALRDYYDKWYRPDLQAIIIVGDIDIDAVEARIKTMFADIQPNDNPAERVEYEVPANEKPIVAIYTDPEETKTTIAIYKKHDIYPQDKKGSNQYLIDEYTNSLIRIMINNRINDMTQKVETPFSYGYFYDGRFVVSKTKESYSISAISKEGKSVETIEALVLELKKINKFGFNASELERAKAEYMSNMESIYNERDKQKNRYYVYQCIYNFQDNEPLPSIEYEYILTKQIEPMITLEAINKIAMQSDFTGDKDMVVTITAPKKDNLVYPTEDEVIKIISTARDKDVVEYTEIINNDPLITKKPKTGKIKSSKFIDELGATEWTLSNGAKVVYKKTDFKADEIQFGATSKGGQSLEMDKNAKTLYLASQLASIGGLGTLDQITLDKKLAGKKAYVGAYFNIYSEGMYGETTPKDLETMMQLIYLKFTGIRQDQDAFNAYISKFESILKNSASNPNTTLQDSIASILYNNHPLKQVFKYEDLAEIDYAEAIEIFKSRFSNAGDFTFCFVGNIDDETLKPLVEQYIASLPSSKTRENYKIIGAEVAKGNVVRHYEKVLETPKSTVYINYSGEINPIEENRIKMDVLGDIMDILYTEKVREDEGGTYGVSIRTGVSSIPTPKYNIMIRFDTNPEMKDKLISIIHAQIDEMATNGPRQKDLDKVKENKIKKHKENLKENSYWNSLIYNYYAENINTNENYEQIINSLTVEEMKQFVKDILKDKNVKEIVQSSKQ